MMEFISPMLARVFDEKKDEALWTDPNWIAEKKLNGHRLLTTKSKCYSRLGTEKQVPFIQECLCDGLMLDGEVLPIDEVGDHSDVSHWLSEDQTKLKYVIFDILYHNGESVMMLSYSLRRKILEGVFLKLKPANDRVCLIEAVKEDKKEWARKLIDEQGAEGVILKDTRIKYCPKSRAHFVKYKWFTDYDVIVADAEGLPSEWTVRPGATGTDGVFYPEGKHTAPWLAGHKNLRYGLYDEELKEVVLIGTLGVTGPKEELETKYPKGSVAIVKAYGQYEDTGALKHPVFQCVRDDKRPEECTHKFDSNVLVKNGILKVRGA